MLPGVGCSGSARSPAQVPLYLPSRRCHRLAPTDWTSVGMLSGRAGTLATDSTDSIRDDFTGSTCVKTVELERPPICRVKSAPLKSHSVLNTQNTGR